MKKKSLIILGTIFILIVGVSGVLFYFQNKKSQGSVAYPLPDRLDFSPFSHPPREQLLQEVTKGWMTIPDVDLNAGNIKYPCERGYVIRKTIEGKEYPIFLADEQLTNGSTTGQGIFSIPVYGFHDNDVWYLDYVGCGIIVGADKETFKPIGYRNAVDKNHAYFEYRVVQGADLKTYELYKPFNVGGGSEWWARDKNFLYYKGEKVSVFATALALGDGWIKTDSKIFYQAYPVEGIDARSFVRVGGNYQKDKNNVYITGSRIEGSDVETFQRVDSNYLKDKNRVYFARSRTGGIYGAVPIENEMFTTEVDAQTFVAVKSGNGYYYKDKDSVYLGYGEKLTPLVGVEPSTFEVLSACGCVGNTCAYYAKDSSHVFCDNKMLKDADPATFTPIGDFDITWLSPIHLSETISKDKNCLYQQGNKMLRPDGVCISPLECTNNVIDMKEKQVCGYPFKNGKPIREIMAG